MSKRFTDTEKWKKIWFRSLSPLHKCFWNYLCDNCNHAGLWEVDFSLASFFIGEPLTIADVKDVFFKQYIETSDKKKWLIKDFIEFQYGVLSPHNRAHLSVINILKKEGAYKGLESPPHGGKDKNMDKDKDKDMDKDKDKETVKLSVDYLNEKAGTKYKHSGAKVQRHLPARLKEGFTLTDIKQVIDIKVADWKGNEKMAKYLRPETLFGTKFESYLNEKPVQRHAGIAEWVKEGANDQG